MKKIELFGYNINAIPHPEEENSRLLVMESHLRDPNGMPLDVIVIGLTQEVADELAKKLAGDEIVIARTMPGRGFDA